MKDDVTVGANQNKVGDRHDVIAVGRVYAQ